MYKKTVYAKPPCPKVDCDSDRPELCLCSLHTTTKEVNLFGSFVMKRKHDHILSFLDSSETIHNLCIFVVLKNNRLDKNIDLEKFIIKNICFFQDTTIKFFYRPVHWS